MSNSRMADAKDPLREAFERFKHDRGKLKKLLIDTQREFRGIQNELEDMPFAREMGNLLLLDSEKTTVERVFQAGWLYLTFYVPLSRM
jgi:hypothetical protein